MIELKNEDELKISKTLRIDEYLLPSSYSFLLLIYMTFISPIDGNFDKLLLFIESKNYSLLKSSIIDTYVSLNESGKKKIRDFIKMINKSDTKKKLKSKIYKIMDEDRMWFFYLYLLKLLHNEEKENHVFDLNYLLDIYNFGKYYDHNDLFPLNKKIITKTVLLKLISNKLDELNKLNITDIFCYILIFDVLKEVKDKQIIFNKLFIDIELFLTTGKTCIGTITYYCLLYSYNINQRLEDMMEQFNSYYLNKDNIHKKFFCDIVSKKLLIEITDIHKDTYKFINYISYFYQNILLEKKKLPISKKEEEIITKILKIVVKICKDNNYSRDKYSEDLEYIKINIPQINLYYYFVLSYILQLDTNITSFISKYVIDNIKEVIKEYIIVHIDDDQEYELEFNISPTTKTQELPSLTDREERSVRYTRDKYEHVIEKFTIEELKLILYYYIIELYKLSSNNSFLELEYYNNSLEIVSKLKKIDYSFYNYSS